MLETEVPAIVELAVRLLLPHVKKLKPVCKGAGRGGAEDWAGVGHSAVEYTVEWNAGEWNTL